MSNVRKFPAITGACNCGLTRYRMETSPLYCYACHCLECQKQTGSAFFMAAIIESDCVTPIGPLKPARLVVKKRNGNLVHNAVCSKCHTVLWGAGDMSEGLFNVRIGTLDFPDLMEPDIHSFIKSKVSWLTLPESAKTCEGSFDMEKVLPKSSLMRLEAFTKRHKAALARVRDLDDGEVGQGGDETPTAGSPKEKEQVEFEKHCDEIEASLRERLEKLNLKLSDVEKPE